VAIVSGGIINYTASSKALGSRVSCILYLMASHPFASPSLLAVYFPNGLASVLFGLLFVAQTSCRRNRFDSAMPILIL